MHENTLNQLLFQLWQVGGLNLTLDKAFIDQVNTFTGNLPTLTLTTSLLRAGTILNVLSPGRNQIYRWDGSTVVAVDADDPVRLRLRPRSVPYIRFLPTFTAAGTRELQLQISDLEIQVIGNGVGGDYIMATLVVNATVNGSVDIVTFSNPTSQPQYTNLQALNVTLDPHQLVYTMQVLDGSTNNPLGLSPDTVRGVATPLVRSLIVPLLNNVLKEVPLPSIAYLSPFSLTDGTNCGIDMGTDKLKVENIAVNDTSTPMVLLRLSTNPFFFNPGVTPNDTLGQLLECN